MITVLITKFNQLNRGNTEKLKNLCKKFKNGLEKAVVNIKIKKKQFYNKMINTFNSYHTEVINMKLETVQKIMKYVKIEFGFVPRYPRALLGDILLEDEETAYFNEIYELKEFTYEKISDVFISHFKKFIEKYDEITKSTIKRITEACCLSFFYNFKIFNDKLIKDLRVYLNEICTFSVQKFEILIHEICEDSNPAHRQ